MGQRFRSDVASSAITHPVDRMKCNGARRSLTVFVVAKTESRAAVVPDLDGKIA